LARTTRGDPNRDRGDESSFLRETLDRVGRARVAKLTLTKLYNKRPTWLDLAHKALDEAVFDAYGWDPSMTDEQILAALLQLNLERSATGDAAVINAETDAEPAEEAVV
jgi:hypothetical protein